MRRSTVVILAFLIVIFVGAMLLLRSYKFDLVQSVVLNSVLQKAPQDYPMAKIRRVFEAARQKAEIEQREQEHLEKLLALSQRLEKVQQLGEDELADVLGTLATDGVGEDR